MEVVRRLGSLQFDPLDTPGVRNHDLVLGARLRDYDPALAHTLLYGHVREATKQLRPERALFEAYNKSLSILPLAELPAYRFAWKRAKRGHAGMLVSKHAAVARAIVARLRSEGALASSAFDKRATVTGYWGTKTSLSRHVLDALFMTGRIGIARREGNARTYDLIERLIDPALLRQRVSDDEATRHRLLSRHRAVGLMGERAAPELVGSVGDAKSRKRHLSKLVDRGELVPARVEGVTGVRFVLRDEARLALHAAFTSERAVSLLAPLDPLMWDRKLVKELFDFTYTWEVYTKVHKRKYGYYVLPVLFGTRLVARIEPRFDRRTGELHVAGLWAEREDTVGDPVFVDALHRALGAHARVVGAKRLTFGRTESCQVLVRSEAQRHDRSRPSES